jgi:alkylation response protein AidB-like acyl-CoA dehydrogenase
MDFSRVDLDPENAAFLEEVRAFVDEFVTDEVLAEVRRSGSKHDATVLQEMGRLGWLLPRRPREQGGAGLSKLHAELLEHELNRSHVPMMVIGTTSLVLAAVEKHCPPDLAEEVRAGYAAGRTFICLGYTEPDSGSDIAAARTRAVRDGDGWVINGSKMFTTEAHHCQYTFLITRTDPEVRKHRGLTMFLVPLDTPGVEIRELPTIGDERTNVVYYTDVRISDRYRMGEVNGGWAVLRGPLDEEHGEDRHREVGSLSIAGEAPGHLLVEVLDAAVRWATTPADGGSRPIDDAAVRDGLGWIATEVDAAAAVPDPFGRVSTAEALIRSSAELLRIVGPRALLRRGAAGAIEDGIFEETHRMAQAPAIRGGTIEIFRNLTAQHVLGLPRQLPPAA